MIKKFDIQDIDKVMDIWLRTNISAHSFIEQTHWEEAFDMVKSAILSSDLFVCQDGSDIKGFVGITDHNYIAGLFIDEQHQSQGIGYKLLNHCKERYPSLELDVFTANKRAVRFYINHGFHITLTQMNQEFNHMEHHMIWMRNH